jgi:hypothetical protein
MTSLRAHFDGRVLVPDEPVDLPRDRVLEIEVRALDEPAPPRPGDSFVFDERNGFPVFRVPPDARRFGLADVQRAEDEP